MNKNIKKVIVAMSGGVDSSVTAVLLREQGFAVTGLYLRLFQDAEKEIQIKKIAKAIGTPLIIRDVKKDFKKSVISYFLREYQVGRTPNPCVVCNKEIKFKFLFQELTKLKVDYVATGHYARIVKREIYYLIEARDKTKDQSYFLYTLNQKQLAKILFPLGSYEKEEIKKLAKKLKLPIKENEESQNICFINDKYPDNFLKRNLKLKAGDIVSTDGKILGRHYGLPLYTLGQRRGMNIGGKGPYFVVAKNIHKNEMVVASGSKIPGLFRSSAILSSVKWVGIKPKLPAHVLSQTRYHNPKVNAIIKVKRDLNYEVIFEKPQRAVTSGQSTVFYTKKGEVIGGGVIN
jgi:tRNA-uridine 2-sulfurtransferase